MRPMGQEGGAAVRGLWRRAARLILQDVRGAEGRRLLQDINSGHDLSQWEPDLCIQMLKIPAAQNYAAISKLLKRASKQWMLEFLECDGLGVLLESLEKLGAKGFSSVADTFSQLQCVSCLRAVMNSQVGLEYIVQHQEYTRQLANILMSHNNSVKLQVFELLCALCIYSSKGHSLALDSLNYFKISHGRRYKFDLVIHELQTADTVVYQTTLLAFVNCAILGASDIHQRNRIRTEFFGVGLERILSILRHADDDALQIQLKVFDENQAKDEEQQETLSVFDLFDDLYKKVADTPQVLALQSLLLALTQIDPKNPDSDQIWESLQEAVVEPKRTRRGSRKGGYTKTRDFGTQTKSNRWVTVNRRASCTVGMQVDLEHKPLPINLLTGQNGESISVPNPSSLSADIPNVDRNLPPNTTVEICKNCLRPFVREQQNQTQSHPSQSHEENNNQNIPKCETSASASKSPNQRLSFTKIKKPSPLQSVSVKRNENVIVSEPLVVETNNLNLTTVSPLPQKLFNKTDQSVSITTSDVCLPIISVTTSIGSQLSVPPPPPPQPPPLFQPQHESSSTFSHPSSPIPVPFPQPSAVTSSPVPPPPPLPQLLCSPLPPPVNSSPSLSPPPPPPPLPPPLPVTPETSSTLVPLMQSPSSSKSFSSPLSSPPPPPLPQLLHSPIPPPIQNSPLFSPPPPPPPGLSSPVSEPLFEKVSGSELVLSPFKTTSTNYHTLPTRRLNTTDLDSGFHKFNTLPKPSKKMKVLNWTKVPNQIIEKSVWATATAPLVPLDYSQIEELFCQKPRPKSAPSHISLEKNSPVLTTLLDNKRSLAVNIFLKQFKNGAATVLEAMRSFEGLSAEKLKGFLRILPEDQEVSLISSYAGELDTLDTAEKFFAQLIKVPDYTLRVQAMLQKDECPLIVSELKPQLETIIGTCDSLIHNSKLAEFLALLLQLGNYLNAGSYAGNAAGFKLNTLPKLLDTRANKPRMTFLHFAIEVAEGHAGNMLSFIEDLTTLQALAKNPLTNLEEEVKALSACVKKLEKQIKNAKSKDLLPKFKEFLKKALKEVDALEKLVGHAKVAEKQLAIHFCEDPKKFQLEECFLLLADFFSKIKQAKIDNELRKKQEERAAKLELDKLSLAASPAIKKKSSKQRIFQEEDSTDLVDILMNEIKVGKFKLRRSLPASK